MYVLLLLMKNGNVEKVFGPVTKDQLASASLVLARLPEYEGYEVKSLTLDAVDGITLDAEFMKRACETALECFRGIYDELEDQGEDNDVLDNPAYWPLSVLRFATGNQSDKDQAEAFLRGDYDEEEDEEEGAIRGERIIL